MWPGNGVLGTRRTRSGLQLGPDIQNVAWEWRSGNGSLRIPKNSEGFLRIPVAAFLSGSVRIPPRPPWGVKTLSFETTRKLTAKAVR
eukprot:4624887-Pyramimonas_sp.AAC.1